MYETCGLGEREKNTRCGLWRLYWSVLKTIQVCVYVPPRKTFLISRACKGLHRESSANSSNDFIYGSLGFQFDKLAWTTWLLKALI